MTRVAPRALAVLDAFDGGPFELSRRDRTLDGAVAVRAAQACLPLLEGNALGLQVRLTRSLPLRRARLGRRVTTDEDFVRRHRAALPRLAAAGLVRRAFAEAFAEGPFEERGRVLLFTGLLVEPPAGTVLRVTHAGNRRPYDLGLEEALVAAGQGLVPLVLALHPGGDALVGEIATLHLARPDLDVSHATLAEAPDVGRAHETFYDAAYFERKRGGAVTRKYKRLVADLPRDAGHEAAELVAVVDDVTVERRRVWLDGAHVGPHAATRGPSLSTLVVRARLDFTVRWDGQTLAVDHDRAALAAEAARVEAAFARLATTGAPPRHQGALLYLTKYFTPHPPGEPHFFVKPWSFLRTTEGVSAIVDGAAPIGPWDVLRGVIATDRFHATPAVFRVHQPGRFVVVKGTPLADVVPVPRALLDVEVRALDWPR